MSRWEHFRKSWNTRKDYNLWMCKVCEKKTGRADEEMEGTSNERHTETLTLPREVMLVEDFGFILKKWSVFRTRVCSGVWVHAGWGW